MVRAPSPCLRVQPENRSLCILMVFFCLFQFLHAMLGVFEQFYTRLYLKPISCLVEEIQWVKGHRESDAWPSLFVVYSCSTSWCLSVCRFTWNTPVFTQRTVCVCRWSKRCGLCHFNCAENLTLSCQTKAIRPHLHLISYWQRALLLILIFNCAEVLCLCELELHWYFLFCFFVNQRTAERCYVKHSEATAVMVSSLYLAFFCARWTLQAYELNVSWRADSELAEGGGGSQSQKGENKGRRRRMRTWRRVGGSRLRHMFSRRGLELVLPRLRLQTNHMRCTSSTLLLQQQLVFAPDGSAQTQCELAVLQPVK